MQIIEGAGGWRSPAVAAHDWVEHLKVADLSVGTYCIPVGGFDDQSPHTEDEIYVVTAGRATIVTPAASADVSPGSVIFIPAGEEHRFAEVTEDLALLVVFGPAYGSRSSRWAPAPAGDADLTSPRSFAAGRAVCWGLRFWPLGAARAYPGHPKALPRAVARRRRPLLKAAGWPGSNAHSPAVTRGLGD